MSFLNTNKKAISITAALVLVLKVIILDQTTKAMVLLYFNDNASPLEILPILNMVEVYNTGISFGFLSGMANGNIILSTMVVIVVITMWAWFLRNITVFNILPIGLITGGAIGNLIDRFIHQGVLDFIDFHWGSWHYPAFNIADGAIVLGVLVLALGTFITKK